MSMRWSGSGLWGVLVLGLGLGGCAKSPQVHVDELPVKRVVVYRNGVAYFERNGSVGGERVQFSLRRENVGDFLATLAILEKGGSSVKAASFPVDIDDEEDPEDGDFERTLDAWEGKRPKKGPALRTVTLELDGEDHELTVGYLAETPVWRPSYRLVVGEAGQAELQAWGIVQNQSGEDWANVEISLVAGAPIAFESDLGEPVVPPRPLVTDSGEIIAAVPEGDMIYAQSASGAAMGPAPAQAAAPEEMESAYDDAPRMGASKATAARARPSASKKDADKDYAMAPSAPPAPAPSVLGGVGAVRDQSRLASVAAQTGSTRYDVPVRVTIPNQSATMVLLVSRAIPGEAVYLYAPDAGVPDSQQHPFRVARFKNASGGLLEKGPIAVFEKGAFLGQGVMSSLPSEASATVPFALIRGVAVQLSYGSDHRGSRLYSISNGTLVIEVDQAVLTTYHVQNGEKDPLRLLVRHPRNPQAKLWQPPTGTEEDLSSGVAFVPVSVGGFASGELVVEERYPQQMISDFRAVEARSAITEYLSTGSPSTAQRAALEKVLAFGQTLGTAADDEMRLRREQAELEKASRETRLSIEAIEKNTQAAALRAELTERLKKTTLRLDQITKELITIGLGRSEAEVRLKQVVDGLTVLPPDQRAKQASAVH